MYTFTAAATAPRATAPVSYANVLIVGAGPVGTSLAADLFARGVDVTLAEQGVCTHGAHPAGITLLQRTEVLAFVQTRTFVEVVLLDLEDQMQRRIRCRYLVGCDGHNSRVRRQINARICVQRDRRMVADRLRDRNVFIAGAAAHTWLPGSSGGLDASISEALSLSALLAGGLLGTGSRVALGRNPAQPVAAPLPPAVRLAASTDATPPRLPAAVPAAHEAWPLAA